LYEVIVKFSTVIEAVSADEAILDVSSCGWEVVPTLISQLRSEIFTATQCTASVGCGPNKLIARLATERAKPNSFYIVHPRDVDNLTEQAETKLTEDDDEKINQNFFCGSLEDFVQKFYLEDLPGIGEATVEKLHNLGITSVDDLKKISLTQLKKIFGEKSGTGLYNSARGIDEQPLKIVHERKSIGVQLSWGVRFVNIAQIQKFFYDLSKEAATRLQKDGFLGKRVTLRIKKKKEGGKESVKFMNPGSVDMISKSITLQEFTDSVDVIAANCQKLFAQMKVKPTDLRGAGIQIDQLINKQKHEKQSVNTLTNYFKKVDEKVDMFECLPPSSTKPIIDRKRTSSETKQNNKKQKKEDCLKGQLTISQMFSQKQKQ